ncbi:MAG: hypothetical protein R2713_23050 [Ilumatobacteraceae bacterium]
MRRPWLRERRRHVRHSADEFLLTAAEPNLSYFQNLIGHDRVEIGEISHDWASLAVQGPRSFAVLLSQLAPEITSLGFFEHTPANRRCRGHHTHGGSRAIWAARSSARPAARWRCGMRSSTPARRTG